MECFCGVAAHTAQCKKGKNEGKWFHGCGRYGSGAEPCKFFKWAKEGTPKKRERSPSPRLKRSNAVMPVTLKRARSRSLTPPLPATQLACDEEIEEVSDIDDQLRPKVRSITRERVLTLDRMIAELEKQQALRRDEVSVYQGMLTKACNDLVFSGCRGVDRRIMQVTEQIIRQAMIESSHAQTDLDARIFLLQQERQKQVQ